MKKNTLIRNDSPHAVNMPEGARLAARKTRKPSPDPVPQEVPKALPARKVVSPKAVDILASPVPPSIAAKPRASARLKPKAAAARAPTAPLRPPAKPKPPAPVLVPVDEAAIWEADNPVKSRLTQLKARNAVLEEQLQRLQAPFQARGKRP